MHKVPKLPLPFVPFLRRKHPYLLDTTFRSSLPHDIRHSHPRIKPLWLVFVAVLAGLHDHFSSLGSCLHTLILTPQILVNATNSMLGCEESVHLRNARSGSGSSGVSSPHSIARYVTRRLYLESRRESKTACGGRKKTEEQRAKTLGCFHLSGNSRAADPRCVLLLEGK